MKASCRPFVVVFVVFAAVMTVVGVSRWMAPQEIVPWRGDFAAARAEAASSGKPLFAYFTADWCGPCYTLKSTTWADRDVEAALRAYVPVKVDVELNAPVALEYNAETLPRFAVLDADGKVVKWTDGYLDPEAFLAWLKG
ncbi:MAG: thioredoxin family protein [Planctomycetota bacterium]|nr:thioredoxin family protein [Planctomycetota bacterium]